MIATHNYEDHTYIGGNPAFYSLKLMHYIGLELHKFDADSTPEDYYETDPKVVMDRGQEQMQKEADERGFKGSTTALLALLRVGDF